MLKYFVYAAGMALVLGGGSLIIWNIRTRKENLSKKQVIKVHVLVFGLMLLLVIGTFLMILVYEKLRSSLW